VVTFVEADHTQKLGDTQYAVPEMLKILVVDDHLGLKTGRGFYEYEE